MKGILKEKSEIEKLKKEYQMFSELNFNFEKDAEQSSITKEELILEECEL
ncbi:hypothetical protein SAMN04488062_10668 [Flavobacterium omnivorum]|uniref:Uncharacterized protein n=1 Tax=Flavobacterium omnivorum TaxID=178355 RepID=A0A1G8BK01_9FLAO|nr:hypothetical protein [Flavobacterium omnivorum]SDH33364.1 hypothetical protein SAMN04488062_10668 [Flavobacterium omnivorum]